MPINTLSEKGTKAIGHIFDDGLVPVVRPDAVWATVGIEPALVVLVDWNELTDDQQDQCLEYISRENNHADVGVIRKGIEDMGYLPMQENWFNVRLV